MKRYKEKIRRLCTVLLALIMCMTFMPAGAFAEDEPDVQNGDETVVEQAPALEALEAEEPAADASAAGADTAPDASTDAAEPSEEPVECTHTSLKKIPAVKAKCNKEGVVEHYQCVECGKKFLDAECTQEVTDDSQIVIPADPEAHIWGEWEVTKEATAEHQGESSRICAVCGTTETEPFDYIEPVVDDGSLVKKIKFNDFEMRFNEPVYEKPDAKLNNSRTGRVWIKGYKLSIKVNWENPEDVTPIDGVIILKGAGKDPTVFREVKRVKFKTYPGGVETIMPKTSFTDKTVKSNKTTYTYRIVSYVTLSDVTYISRPVNNDWASGRMSTSKLKNVYSGSINKKSVKLQSKDTTKLKVTVSKPKTKLMPDSRRWSSSDKSIATVSKSGKVTAKAPGTATISCRLASGAVVTSKINVVGAFTPGTPELKVDYATTSSITLIWNKVKNATSYDIYKSNDGLHWEKQPRNTKKTTYTFGNLTKNHRYTFYLIARNDHEGVDEYGDATTYTAFSDNSNVLNQKAVVKRRPMTLTGFPTSTSPYSGSSLSYTIKVNPPLGRTASLQMRSGRKWVTKKIIRLPGGSSQKSVNISFTNDWWGKTTSWRLVIPPTVTTSGYTSKTLKITARRRYQNPSSYVQISDTIGKHGYSHYVSPVLVNGTSSRSDHVEALIRTARKYLGDSYVQSRSGAPGKGIDESGLVIQACYGAGVDLWPISPSTRPYNCIPNIMKSKLKAINYVPAAEGSNDYTTMIRGDLIFFSTSENGTPIHMAIYTGLGGLIQADPIDGRVNTSTIRTLEDPEGSYKYYVVGVRRIFN